MLDPGVPATRDLLSATVKAMISPTGLDADDLKVDFTARTPSGQSLTCQSPSGQSLPGSEGPWGAALLHELLAIVYKAAKSAKPGALVITHAPHPSFADVADMIRLNDMLRLDDPGPDPDVVAQMSYRAAVVREFCPDLLIDSDDWCAPDLGQWRRYLAVKPKIGVPALYYKTHLDHTGEALEERDYAALRSLWHGGKVGT